jgi:hypothetical protein
MVGLNFLMFIFLPYLTGAVPLSRLCTVDLVGWVRPIALVERIG